MTQQQVIDLFDYKDGDLIWKEKIFPGHRSGQIAGSVNGSGYKHVRVNGKIVLQHRVVFLMYHGYLPKYIDHRDNDRLNNKIGNLRAATARQNQANRKVGKNNKSGYTGVSFEKHLNKYVAGMQLNGKHVNLGRFDTAKEASDAYNKLAVNNFKEFANV